MRFDVLTLFPDIFSGYLGQSILRRALDRGLVQVHLWNIRDWATGKHKSVDDRPYGGGAGMVMRCEPVFACVEAVQAAAEPPGRLIMLTPQGRRLDQRLVEQLSTESRLLLLCGRYEGFDERIRIGLKPTEVSVGDYVAAGGEAPAMLIIDTVSRLVPGVLGDEESSRDESFSDGLIEYPHYTRPSEFRGMRVPDILMKGNHQEIARWRRRAAQLRTQQRRADLLPPAGEPPKQTGRKEP
jgi:tRNA (guanine37-N1)-methyltransferase